MRLKNYYGRKNHFLYHQNSNIIDAFIKVQDLLRKEEYPKAWNCFTKSYQEAKHQGDINGFIGKVSKDQAIDHWTAFQFLQLLPEESVTLEDGRILLNLTLDSSEWHIIFKYSDE